MLRRGCQAAPGFLVGCLLLVLALPAFSSGRTPFVVPDEFGPFAVGRVTLFLEDPARDDRPVPVDIWYPVDAEDAVAPLSLYLLLGFAIVSDHALSGPPVAEAGGFPLVVFSHGSGGIRFQSFFLTEILASHGFVVAAPDHLGNTLLEGLIGIADPFEEAFVNRIGDVSFLIDRMLEKSADPTDPFHGSVDPRRIGVTGHSFGGLTSLALAAGFSGEAPDGIELELPPDFEPIPPDRRVRAIVPIAPVSSVFSDSELAGIQVPTMIIGGSLDTTTPIDSQSTRPFELIHGRAFLAELQGAVHFSFSNSCDLVQVLVDGGFSLEFIEGLIGSDFIAPCGADVLDIAEAHRLTSLYAVAHLRRHLMRAGRYEFFLGNRYSRIFEPDVIFSR